jgi:hypothetical protein
MFDRFSEAEQQNATEALRTWLAQAGHARPTPSPESDSDLPTPATSGPMLSKCFALFVRDSSGARMSLVSSQASLVDSSEEFCPTWPSSGSMRDGQCSERTMLAPRTEGSGSGFWPTPSAQSYGSNRGGSAGRVGPVRESLETMARTGNWPTPTAGDAKASEAHGYSTESGRHSGTTLTDATVRRWRIETMITNTLDPERWLERQRECAEAGGSEIRPTKGLSLNPSWVEWLQGVPIEWTACAPLATCRFLRWWSAHGKS